MTRLPGGAAKSTPAWKAPRPVNGSERWPKCDEIQPPDDRPAARHDTLAEAAGGHQALEDRELALAIEQLRFERIDRGRDLRDLGGSRRHFLRGRAAERRRLVEIELATIEVGQVGDATAERVEADQVGVQRADTSRQRIDLALHFATNRIQVEALLVEIAVHRGAVERPGDETAELQACSEHETRGDD